MRCNELLPCCGNALIPCASLAVWVVPVRCVDAGITSCALDPVERGDGTEGSFFRLRTHEKQLGHDTAVEFSVYKNFDLAGATADF